MGGTLPPNLGFHVFVCFCECAQGLGDTIVDRTR
eukprot:COSAG06_NODE_31126_length_526_cov_1.569087_1_plen_33_part_10